MKAPDTSSTIPELELEQAPVRSGSDSLSPLNARTFTLVILALSLMLVLGEAWRRRMVEASEKKDAVENCRKIVLWLRMSAPDLSGSYPYKIKDEPPKLLGVGKKGPSFASHDAQNSNEVFRELFKIDIYKPLNDELKFGCPRSPFHPDGNAGTAPLFREALQKGENHWAMSKDLFDSASGAFALIFENPADASMPPRWDTDVAGQAKPGRCWTDRTVCVGFNDGTVRWIPLEPGLGLRKLKEDVFSSGYSSSAVTGILQVDE